MLIGNKLNKTKYNPAITYTNYGIKLKSSQATKLIKTIIQPPTPATDPKMNASQYTFSLL